MPLSVPFVPLPALELVRIGTVAGLTSAGKALLVLSRLGGEFVDEDAVGAEAALMSVAISSTKRLLRLSPAAMCVGGGSGTIVVRCPSTLFDD